MSKAQLMPDIDDDAAETEALRRATEEARKDRCGLPHSEVREWLLRIAAGDFSAKLPPPRDL